MRGKIVAEQMEKYCSFKTVNIKCQLFQNSDIYLMWFSIDLYKIRQNKLKVYMEEISIREWSRAERGHLSCKALKWLESHCNQNLVSAKM